jgi:NhaP-type Na+/H+ or K+/H+ antiporter
MHENLNILIIVLMLLSYGYFSNLFQRFNISGPMIFMAVGIILSPLGLGLTKLQIDAALVETVAELGLIIVLFSDASRLQLKKLHYQWNIPARLLIIGLPLTIIFSNMAANFFFPQESVAYLLLMALILAPTDAALGKAVVTDKALPEKIRSGINIESGLNDGIVYPLLAIVVTMIISGGSSQEEGWFGYVLREISFGALTGAITGYIGARLATIVMKKGWIAVEFKNFIPIALAILSYYLAVYIGGNGFIAAFFTGLFVGNFNEDLKKHTESFAESEGDLLILITFMVFGLVFIPATIAYWTPQVFLYAILSLTAFRMIPVAISMIGSKEDLSTVLFLGWFGPRGIASILYVLLVVNQIGSIKGHETVYAVISLTIFLSIILHGLSAQPLVEKYARGHQKEKE